MSDANSQSFADITSKILEFLGTGFHNTDYPMYYLNLENWLNDTDSYLRRIIEKAQELPPETSIFDCQIN